MKIGRELFVTGVTALGVLVGLSVLQGWDWPLLDGSVRWGVAAVGVVSLVACSSSGWATADPRSWYRNPWIIAAMVIGTATLVVGVVGLITGAETWLSLMIAGTILLWVVSTLHHVFDAAQGARRLTAA